MKNIFIHIPKTGGSTFVGLLKDSVDISNGENQQPTHVTEFVGETLIKHIDFSTYDRKFKSPDIFDVSRRSYYKDNFKLFMLVRNPFDRLLSEFNFQYHMLNGKNGNPNAAIITRLSKLPHSFKEYCQNSETQNYQCKFLLGRKLADPSPVTKAEFETLLESIDALPVYCGITESYSDFLKSFQHVSGVELKSDITLRKKTPSHLKQEASESTKIEINSCNIYDIMLYEHIKNSLISSQEEADSFNFQDKNRFIV